MVPKPNRISFSQIGISIFHIIAVVYLFVLALSLTVDWNDFLPFLQDVFGWTTQNNGLVWYFHHAREIVDITYPGVFRIVPLIFIPTALYSALVLYAGRNLFETFMMFNSYLIPLPKQSWGRTADMETSRALPFCAIHIETLGENDKKVFVADTVSDLFGRYRISFLAEKGKKYFLAAQVMGYNEFLRELKFEKTATVFVYDEINLRPEKGSSTGLNRFLQRLNAKVEDNVVKYLHALSIISVLFGIYGLIQVQIPGTIIFVINFAVAAIWNTYFFTLRKGPKQKGRLLYMENGAPAAGIGLELFRNGSRMALSTTTGEGLTSFSVDPGMYEVRLVNTLDLPLVKRGNEYEAATQVEISEYGVITETLYVQYEKKQTSAGTLPTPFGD